jgi:CheY-like chemotaxis protein
VVDDQRFVADGLALYLRESGYEVEAAYSGAQALELARRSVPDFVLLDIGMPDMDGYELADTLQGVVPASCVLIAISGYAPPVASQRMRRSRIVRHLVKPVDCEALVGVLREYQQSARQG